MPKHPVVNQKKIVLRKATAGNVQTEPGTNSIAQNEYTQAIGFGGNLYDIVIEFVENAGAGNGIVVETSGTRNFAVVTVPEARSEPPYYGGVVDAAGFTVGQQIIVRSLEGAGWWRVKNTMAGAIRVSYQIRAARY